MTDQDKNFYDNCNAESLVNELRHVLPKLTSEQRRSLVDFLLENYCKHCFGEFGPKGYCGCLVVH
jgi:hypothetical protein